MENIKDILVFSLIGVSILIIAAILMQQREGGLSTVFGGDGAIYRSRRGIAKGLHYFTIALGVIFVGLSVAVLIIK